jgi:DNA repair ATPase RecN
MSTDQPKNERLAAALNEPNGARFFKCALQLNPWSYLHKHNKPAATTFANEAAYNAAMVDAVLAAGIEVASVTDHFEIDGSAGLVTALEQAGVVVFPGFEAKSSDGVHLLCLFEPGTQPGRLSRCIGQCGVIDPEALSPSSTSTFTELLEMAATWPAATIAAHATNPGGVLRQFKGQARIAPWKHSLLLAIAIPGQIDNLAQDVKSIIQNTQPEYRRASPIACVNAADINSPEEVGAPGAACFIKMARPTVEGLRQAFLDPDSRIRLQTSAPDERPNIVIEAITWEGGLLDATAIRLNPNLNVLIGGRGAGKSTVVESLRYVLNSPPLGKNAEEAHQSIVRHVLKPGSRISCAITSHVPSEAKYIIERKVPDPPVIKDWQGNLLSLTVHDLVGRLDIFGQHEISEVATDEERRTQLLRRFVPLQPGLADKKQTLRRQLAATRKSLLEARAELIEVRERLGRLPGLEEQQVRFQRAGLEDKLKDKSWLVREERVLRSADERLAPVQDAVDQLKSTLPLDLAFLSPAALEGMPAAPTLVNAHTHLESFEDQVRAAVSALEAVLMQTRRSLGDVRAAWDERKTKVEDTYEKILRELQKNRIDGSEFIQLRKQIEDLRPLRDREALVEAALRELHDRRGRALLEWSEHLGHEHRALETAAKHVQKKLAETVQVQVTIGGGRDAVRKLLSAIKGLRTDAIDSIVGDKLLSVAELAATCRQGSGALSNRYGLSTTMADKLVAAGEAMWLELEELELTTTTELRLNVGTSDQPQFRPIESLSKGQKATAVLLLLLLDENSPLVIDQPEDDLDNRFISDAVVRRIKNAKTKRQLIFATHNANIPVLGDAELIIALTPQGEDQAGIEDGHRGSIDEPSVQKVVESVLEGGKDAFERRRNKYGFNP